MSYHSIVRSDLSALTAVLLSSLTAHSLLSCCPFIDLLPATSPRSSYYFSCPLTAFSLRSNCPLTNPHCFSQRSLAVVSLSKFAHYPSLFFSLTFNYLLTILSLSSNCSLTIPSQRVSTGRNRFGMLRFCTMLLIGSVYRHLVA